MNYIYNQRKIRVEWSIYKGSSGDLEDFSRAYMKVFIIGPNSRYAVEASVSDMSPNVTIDMPQGLPEGVYLLEAIWGKNWMLDDEKFNPTKRPLHSRDLSHAKTPAIFALTSDPAEENIYSSTGTAVVKVRSNVSTYGYDGLDAYQIAVFRGRFSGSEQEWLDSLGDRELINYYTKGEVDELIDNVHVDLSDYYTKGEVDDIVDSVEVDLSGYYTKEQTDTKISEAAAGLRDEVEENTDAINDVSQRVSTNTQGIADNAGNIAANTDAITENTNDINQLKSGMTTMGGRVDELETELDNIVGLDQSNYKGMFSDVNSLPSMTSAGWAWVGSDMTAMAVYVWYDSTTGWVRFGSQTYNMTDYSSVVTQVATIGSKIDRIEPVVENLNDDVYGEPEPELTSVTMQRGVYNAYDGHLQTSTTRICTKNAVQVSGSFQVSVGSGYKFNVILFDESMGFIEAIGDIWRTEQYSGYHYGYIHINVANSSDSTIAATANTGLQVYVYVRKSGLKADVSDMGEDIEGINNDLYGEGSDTPVVTDISFEQGGMLSDGTKGVTITDTRVRTINPLRVIGDFTINMTSGRHVNVFFYNTQELSSFDYSLGVWTDIPYSGNYDGYIMINVKASNDGNISPSDTTATLTTQGYIPGIKAKVEDMAFTPNGYMYGADLIKHPLRVKELGTLTYLQSFCTYGGKYYSINGTKMAEQNSDFSVSRNISLALGHGNALHLGHNGKAYASGWDDQKVYVVDLESLTITQTITLPTTGYTTCAVDDVRGIMYIFQRDSYPDTVAQYNFIVYDYANLQIISTRTLDEPFGAMQSCDYFEGKIMMLYGAGTSLVPSGMKVFNTAGDVLAAYSLDIFASAEPEGICFDREDWRLLVSGYNQKVYQVYIETP